MYLAFLFFYLFSSETFAVDAGTGADGACSEATFVSGKRTYNCTSVTIGAGGNSAFKGQAGTVVIIKATGSVTINGSFDLGGANGVAGSTGDPVTGGNGGPGASSGGTCNLGGSTCGNNANDNNGSGSGAGVGGRRAVGAFAGDASGGGGAGGSFGTSGNAGSTGPNAGGTGGTGGSVGSTYGLTNTWETTFLGGSGGGAGGYGTDSTDSSFRRGGSGGGGGGALRIIAAGDITINGGGSIIAPGGTGGNGQDNGSGVADDGGCGGAGSGGAIWLQAGGNIINAGTVSALGGSATTCNAGNLQGGAGGSGGSGRIRLDDDDGVVANTGTINPAADTNAVSVTTSGTSNQTKRNYEGDLACGSIFIQENGDKGGPGPLTFGMTFLLGLLLTLKRKFPSKA